MRTCKFTWILALILGSIACGRVQAANNDGKIDIVWRHAVTGDNAIWFMDRSSLVTGTLIQPNSDLNWRIGGAGDVNRDGNQDLVWSKATANSYAAWLMDGVNFQAPAYFPSAGESGWNIVGTGDFNQDGKMDLLFRHGSTGQNGIWLMDGTIQLGCYLLPQQPDQYWRIGGTGDFNGDGKCDIVWRHYLYGYNAVWIMDGVNYYTCMFFTSRYDTSWELVGTGDFNGDNQLDLLWRHNGGQGNQVWFMSQTSWIGSVDLDDVQNHETAWKIVATGDFGIYGPPNQAPTISVIPDQVINVNESSGQVPFSINDLDDDVNTLTVTASSSNPYLVPVSQIVISGTGANRAVRVTPSYNRMGTVIVTVTVSDGQAQVSSSFTVTVWLPGQAPIEFPKSSMIADCSSTGWGWLAEYAINGSLTNPGWHGAGNDPQGWLRLDLHQTRRIGRVDYYPRESFSNGTFLQYRIYVTDSSSTNQLDWGDPVDAGAWSWQSGDQFKSVTFGGEGPLGRFVILKCVQGVENFACCNEVSIYYTPSRTYPSPDLDEDGLLDTWEWTHFSSYAQTATGDPDNDGISNANERANGTNPNSGDTDEDGVSDATEIAQYSDPTDPADSAPPPADDLVDALLRIGLVDSANSMVLGQTYDLKVGNYCVWNPVPGNCQITEGARSVKLVEGRSYVVRVFNTGAWYLYNNEPYAAYRKYAAGIDNMENVWGAVLSQPTMADDEKLVHLEPSINYPTKYTNAANKTATLALAKARIWIDGLPETNNLAPGAFVGLSNSPPIPVHFEVKNVSNSQATVVISVTTSINPPGGQVKLYADAQKAVCVMDSTLNQPPSGPFHTVSQEYLLAALPNVLYLEGVGVSGQMRDVTISLSAGNGFDKTGKIESLLVTVLKVDLEFQNSHMSAGKLIDPLSPPRDVRVGVVQGDTVKFKAKLSPTVTLQNGDYVWTGVQSGNGPEIDITFNSAGTHSEQLQVLGCQARIGRTTVVNVTGLGETAWMALHPQYWISAFELRDDALNWAAANWSALGGSPGVHNCRADAARHAYWNAIMTFDWNAADAEGLATAHERTGLDDGGPHNETVMDLENNADGRTFGGGGSTNRVQLQNAVIGALNAGTLTILDDLGNANEVGLLQPSNQ